jgi:hypothetical protein
LLALSSPQGQKTETAKAAAAARLIGEREDAIRMAFDRYRRGKADELFETSPAEERGIIESLARTGNRPFAI